MISKKRKEYLRKYQANYNKKRREEFFTGKMCVKCGTKNNLELDHIDPKTKESHKIWSWSKIRREKELEKCQILCRPCHIDKHLSEQQSPVVREHGLYRKYEREGCRCDLCKKAFSENRKKYPSRKSKKQPRPTIYI